MLDLGPPRRRRRPDLTPMIDVVFLLLVFFMLASRFVTDTTIPLASAVSQENEWPGRLRLVDVTEGGMLRFNGQPVTTGTLPEILSQFTESPDDPILMRGRGANLQEMTAVMETLRKAGFRRLMLVE